MVFTLKGLVVLKYSKNIKKKKEEERKKCTVK